LEVNAMAIFLITAPSGAGKTSVMNLTRRYVVGQEILGECISHTTRAMREGEENGVTYYFVSEEQFNTMHSNGEFAEKVTYDGNLYGVSKEEINRVLNKHNHVYIIVEYNGYKQIKEAFPEAIGIFLHMSKEDCMANMLLRGDTMAKAELRISTYEKEMMNRYHFDYVIKNVRGKADVTARIIGNIIKQYEI
jgi:guanylate kinase